MAFSRHVESGILNFEFSDKSNNLQKLFLAIHSIQSIKLIVFKYGNFNKIYTK